MKIGIIGAGSAGLLAANELGKSNIGDIEIKIFDQGPEVEKRFCPQKNGYVCTECDPCKMMTGIGGAGAFSSGILNLNKNIGGELEKLSKEVNMNANNIISEIDSFFLQNGAPNKVFDPFQNREKLKELRRRCAAVDIRFIPIKQRLLGSENTPEIIKNIQKYLEDNFDVRFLPNTKIVSFNKNKTITFDNGKKETFDFLLIAPGRSVCYG